MKAYKEQDPKYFFDHEGEPLDVKQYKVQKLEDVEDVVEKKGMNFNYDKYFVINQKALLFILSEFTGEEVKRIMELPIMTKTFGRDKVINTILYRTQRSMHTKETLKDHFLLSKSRFNTFFRKLMLKNIIFYGKTGIDGVMTNVILLNPYFTKKGKIHNEFLKTIFKPLK